MDQWAEGYMIVRIMRKDELIMSKQRVNKWTLIILLVCSSIVMVGAIYLRPAYLRERINTRREIRNLLERRGVINPKVSIRGNKVTVKWETVHKNSCGQDDLFYMEEVAERIKENLIVKEIDIHIYNQYGEMIRDYWKGNVGVPTRKGGILNGPMESKSIK